MESGSHSATNFDWNKCIFCQKLTREKLICPGLSRKSDVGAGYKTLSDHVSGYKELGALPQCVNLNVWDEGDGVESTCLRNNACWHPKCRQLLHSTTLDRLRKRGHVETSSNSELLPSDNADDYETPARAARLTRSTSGLVETAFSTVRFFCETKGSEIRHTVVTDQVNERVNNCAKIINDPNLLAKLAQGDMIAIEAKYHCTCLLSLYYKASCLQKATQEVETEVSGAHLNPESLALAEIIAYIEEIRSNEKSPSVFTLSKLIDLYMEQLQLHGVSVVTRPQSTRFKDRLLEHCPDLTAVNHGRDVLLTFNDNLGIALQKLKDTSDSDAVHMMRTAKMIRREMFEARESFNGSFKRNCQKNSVPETLVSLVAMLLEGPGNFEPCDNQAALSISQLIIFNAVKRPRKTLFADVRQRAPCVRHLHNQETPLPIYVGMMLHSATRKKKLVDKCYKMGLSISYDRVQEIGNKLGNSVCSEYNSEQLVCPPILRSDLFTVAAVDNIDHNPSSETAKSSFHGTAISLMQFPTLETPGVDRGLSHSLAMASSIASEIVLPLVYSSVPPCIFPKLAPVIPAVQCLLSGSNGDTTKAEYDWLIKVFECLEHNLEPLNITWAAHHASVSSKESQPLPITAMMLMSSQFHLGRVNAWHCPFFIV